MVIGSRDTVTRSRADKSRSTLPPLHLERGIKTAAPERAHHSPRGCSEVNVNAKVEESGVSRYSLLKVLRVLEIQGSQRYSSHEVKGT